MLILCWLDGAVLLCRLAVESLFAANPTPAGLGPPYLFPLDRLRSKRGGITVGDRLPPVRPGNIPYAVFWALQLVVVGFGIALVALFVRLPGSVTETTVAVLGFGGMAILARHAETLRATLRAGHYENRTAYSTVAGVRGTVFYVITVLLPAIAVTGSAVGVGLAVTAAGIVVVKLASDLLEIRAIAPSSRADETAVAEPDLSVPAGDPDAVVRADRRGILVETILFAPLYGAASPAGVFVLLGVLAVGLVFGFVAGVATLVLTVVVVFAVEGLVSYVTAYNVEYRIYPDAVVAYDTLLDAPQWSIPRGEISDVGTSNAMLSVLFDEPYGKVRLKRVGEGAEYVSPIRNPDEFPRYLAS